MGEIKDLGGRSSLGAPRLEMKQGESLSLLNDEENNSIYLQPVRYVILVKIDEIQPGEELYKGTIIIPDTSAFIPQLTGKLVAVGGNAFCDWNDPKPELGDTLIFNKYAGISAKNKDVREEDWRMLNDTDINGIVYKKDEWKKRFIEEDLSV